MKILRLIFTAGCLLLAMSLQAQNWQLVWSDEFTNGISADWAFETGAGGWGNNELEYYRRENASVSNGQLVITAKHESFGGAQYTSVRMKTQGHKSFKYGRIEARIQTPSFQGVWPAFWMLGDNIGTVGWPACGEIDILEHVNTGGSVNGTIHWADANNQHASYGSATSTSITSFHIYAIEWDTNSIKWFVDGTNYLTANIANNINSTEEFHNNFFILLNLAIGGDWPGFTIDNNAFPANMYVDYVRVYSAGAASSPAPIGKIVTLKGFNNQFVSGENGTTAMWCNRPTAQAWEQFSVVDAGGGKVALKSMGKYVSSENGAASITCSRTSIGDWEKFDWVVNSDGKISLRGNNGKYISSENGTIAMTCNRVTVGGWEAFTYAVVGTGRVSTHPAGKEDDIITLSEDDLSVYPNPSTGSVTIRVAQPSYIHIHDLTGKSVIREHVKETLTVKDLLPGLYIVNMSNMQQKINKKLIIK
jgi:beta-glucanase (GH16 family)